MCAEKQANSDYLFTLIFCLCRKSARADTAHRTLVIFVVVRTDLRRVDRPGWARREGVWMSTKDFV